VRWVSGAPDAAAVGCGGGMSRKPRLTIAEEVRA
jgi:hypothetical protein